MISFLMRTYSVFLCLDSEYGIGECCGTGLVWRLFRMFSEMPARIRSLRSSGIVNASCTLTTTAGFGAGSLEGGLAVLFTGAAVLFVSVGIVRGTGCGLGGILFG